MLVSIIIPVYNTQKYITECVESVYKSGLSDFEIIVVNDGSTDDSGLYCERLKQKYCDLVYINKKNEGVSVARNVGISIAKGEYLLFLDSDDYLFENSLKNIDSYLGEDLIMVGHSSSSDIVDKTYKTEYVKFDYYDLTEKILFKTNENENLNFSSPWGKFYRRNIIIENNIEFIKKLGMGEDMLFNIEYLQYCNSICVDNNICYYFRIREDSVTHIFNYKKPVYDRIFNENLKIILTRNEQSLCNSVSDNIWRSSVVNSVAKSFIYIINHADNNLDKEYIEQVEMDCVIPVGISDHLKHSKIKYKLLYIILYKKKGYMLYKVLKMIRYVINYGKGYRRR